MEVPKITHPRERRKTTLKIPRVIHQTMKSSRLPTHMWTSGPHTWIKHNPAWEHRFYDDKDCEEFIRVHVPEALPAWNVCRIGAMKADLFRYAVLWIHGGLYADIDTYACGPIENYVSNELSYITSLAHGERRSPQHQVIIISSQNWLMKKCIELSIENIINDKPITGGNWPRLAGYAGPPVLDLALRIAERPYDKTLDKFDNHRMLMKWNHRIGVYRIINIGKVQIYNFKWLFGKMYFPKYSGYKKDIKKMGLQTWQIESKDSVILSDSN